MVHERTRLMPRVTGKQRVCEQEMMDAVAASGAYGGAAEFTGAPGADRGKRMDNSATRTALGWAPRHPSFVEFVAAGAQDFYSSQAWVG